MKGPFSFDYDFLASAIRIGLTQVEQHEKSKTAINNIPNRLHEKSKTAINNIPNRLKILIFSSI